jgi:ABC-type transporter MlaC component
MRFHPVLPATLLALCCMTVPAGAAADVAGAQSFVEKEHGELKRLVEANAPVSQVRQAIDDMVDYDELARRTLGKPCPATVPSCKNHWDELTAAQQKEVTGLLRQLVEKNYRKNLTKTKDYAVAYRGAKDQGQNLSKIRTEAKSKLKPRDPPVQVDYLIMESSRQYKVIDIVTEGSSMTKNYYDQFHRMLTTAGQGYPYMVKKLQDKIAAKEKK